MVLDSASTQDDTERLDFLYPKSSDDSDPCFTRPAADFSSSELAAPSSAPPPLLRSDVRLGVLDGGGRLWWCRAGSSAPAGDCDRLWRWLWWWWCDLALTADNKPLSSGGGGGWLPLLSSPVPLLLQLVGNNGSLLHPVTLCWTNRHMSDNRNTLWHWPQVSRSTWSVLPVLCAGSVSAVKNR